MDGADLLQCGVTPAASFSRIAISHESLCDVPLFNDRFALHAAADLL
jgi:hypothetical protein